MYDYTAVLIVILLLIVAFPVYVLVRLSTLGHELQELRAKVATLSAKLMAQSAPSAQSSSAFGSQTRPGPAEFDLGKPPVVGPPVTVPPQVPVPSIPWQPASSLAAPPVARVPMPPGPQPAAESWRAIPHATQSPKAATSPAAPIHRARADRGPKPTPRDIESIVGANWLAKLGVAAIAVASGFFLQFAFRSGWITPWEQVGIGLCGAAAMVGFAQFLLPKERYRSYGQVLASGGIVVYFLSVYAAYAFYHPRLIGYTPAFGALVAGALAASILAMANNTPSVAVICTLGAFAAPVLIRDHGGAVSTDGAMRLYVYLAALNLWVLGLVRIRTWHSLSIVAFACTWILFFFAGPIAAAGWRTESFSALFLLCAVWSGCRLLLPRAEPKDDSDISDPITAQLAGMGMIVAGGVAFLFSSSAILDGIRSLGLPDLAIAGAALAFLLAAMSAAMPDLARNDRGVRHTFAYLSALSVVAVMLALSSSPQRVPAAEVPAAFAFGALNYVVFLAMSVFLGRRQGGQQPAAILVAVNAVVHVVLVIHVLGSIALWGAPAASIWLPIAGVIALCALSITREDAGSGGVAKTLAVAALAMPAVALVRAMWVDDLNLAGHWHVATLAVIGVEFAVLSAAWIRLRDRVSWPEFRCDIAAAISAAAIFFALMAWAVGTHKVGGIVLLAGCAVAMAVYHFAISATALGDRDEDRLLRLIYIGIAITFVTIAIPLQLSLGWVTVAWAVEAAMLLWAGTSADVRGVRIFGYGVLALAAGRSIVLDVLSAPEKMAFLLNGRTVAGAAVVGACYLGAWLLWKRHETLPTDEANAPTVLAIAANLWTLLFLSLDLWDLFGGRTAQPPARANLALTLFWSAYAVGALYTGSALRSLVMRVLGVTLLAIAATKVLLVDFLFEPASFHLFANTRTFAGAAVIAAAYACAWMLWRRRDDGSEHEAFTESDTIARHGLLILANLYTVIFVSRDLWDFFGGGSPQEAAAYRQLAFSLFWTSYALAALWTGIQRRSIPLRVLGLGLLGIAAAKVMVIDFLTQPPHFELLINTRTFAGAAVIIVSYVAAWLLWWKGDELTDTEASLPALLVCTANLFTLMFASMDLWQHVGADSTAAGAVSARQLALSIFWTVYALAAICVGIATRIRPLRLFAMALLYFSIFKVFLFDLANLEQAARIVSFFTLGVILLLVSLLYTKFEERMRDDRGRSHLPRGPQHHPA